MPITEILARNAALYGEDISLVEINPEIRETRASWKEYELVETNPERKYRREITWREFDDKANRLANFLLDRGLQKGHKVAILLMNSLEWLPIYFGILKTGALAVPLNYRYTEEEIKYCLDLGQQLRGALFGAAETQLRGRDDADANRVRADLRNPLRHAALRVARQLRHDIGIQHIEAAHRSMSFAGSSVSSISGN